MAAGGARTALGLVERELRRAVPRSTFLNYRSLRRVLPARSSLICRGCRSIHSTPRKFSDERTQNQRNASSTGEARRPSESSEVPPRRISVRPYIYATGFILIGLLGGQFIRAVVFPPPLPAPESPEDDIFLAKILNDVGNLPIVRELRNQRDEWLEYDAYTAMTPEHTKSNMTAGTLRGSRALGVQRIFYNKNERRLIAVVFFGGSLSGWPGVTHGGVIGTMLKESLERAANGPGYSQSPKDPFRLDSLSLVYKKPTRAEALYIIRAEVDENPKDNVGGPGKFHVRAVLEDAVLKGTTHVTATGICSPANASTIDSVKEEATSIWDSVKQTTGYLFG